MDVKELGDKLKNKYLKETSDKRFYTDWDELAKAVAVMILEARIEDKDLKIAEYSEQVLPSWVCKDLEKEREELESQKQSLLTQ